MHLTTALLLALTLAAPPLCAQEREISPQEYALYEKASQETDPAEKKALLLEFVKTYPKSGLDENIAYLYAQFYESYRRQGNWKQLAAASEEYLQHRPSDPHSIRAATEAYEKLGNPRKLIEFGTRLYQQAPNANTAYFVAKAYQAGKDWANFQKWAERTVQHDPDNLDMLLELVNLAWTSNDLARASNYASRMLKALDSAPKPAGYTDPQWKTQTDPMRAYCYRALGEKAFADNSVSASVKHFETSLKFDPKQDMAYFRLGGLYWRSGRIDEAIMAFAKAFVLDGVTSQEARQQMTSLYQQRYGNTAGVGQIIDSARKQVRGTGPPS